MTQGSERTFECVIQADLETLSEMAMDLRPAANVEEAMTLFYGGVIVLFLRGEVDQIRILLSSINEELCEHPEKNLVEIATRLRLFIRTGEATHGLVDRATTVMNESSTGRWRGEIAMLLATFEAGRQDFKAAKRLFEFAAVELASAGIIRKSLRAQMNVLVCESHFTPNQNLFAKYHDLYRQAVRRDRRETIVATTCLLNISREYQRVGAWLAALKYCNRALIMFERQMGELNYYLTLVHRAEILIALERFVEARVDLDTASLSPFPEVLKAIEAIEAKMQSTKQERLSNAPVIKLSSLEEKLLGLLARGPRERIEIVDEIYGERLDHETKQNRFKSLIGTLRKKFPDLVVFESGKYRLAHEILVPVTASAPSPNQKVGDAS